MILLRLISRTWKALSDPLPVRLPGPRALPSYAQMGRYIAAGVALDPRVDLLVRQLAAELAGCRWCIEYGLHRWPGVSPNRGARGAAILCRQPAVLAAGARRAGVHRSRDALRRAGGRHSRLGAGRAAVPLFRAAGRGAHRGRSG